ncbi:Transcriptional repressor SdpR [Streptomyces sp. MP131-18]|nr:metalloregulator ArsR/SmtB family transcription factor [Streptomyces sp. MP131-18]ONK10652.1 Transcriptional repressor SdpR [Streptomyces sp. MP131-18]
MVDGFAVLADDTRRRILDLLRQAPRDVGEIVRALGLSQPNVSKHLRVLREAGLVEAGVEGRRRVYRLTDVPLRDVEEWLRPYRERWVRHFDALEEHLDRRRAHRESETETETEAETDADGAEADR